MQTIKKQPRGNSVRSRELIIQWQQMAAVIARKYPKRSNFEIAGKIQRSPAGGKWGGGMTYSISYIMKNIRRVRFVKTR